MKLIMTSQESGEIVLDVEASTLTEVIVKAIQKHTEEFGEDYLNEILEAITDIVINEETEYTREDFSDPEANFTIKLIK